MNIRNLENKISILNIGLVILASLCVGLFAKVGFEARIEFAVLYAIGCALLWIFFSWIYHKISKEDIRVILKKDSLSYLFCLILISAGSGFLGPWKPANSVAVITALLAGFTFVVLKLIIFTLVPMRLSKKQEISILISIIGVYIVVVSWLLWRSYKNFKVPIAGDLAAYIQMFWTTIHKHRTFFCSIAGVTHFGVHNSPILFLILPIYAIFQSAGTLFVFQSIAIGLAGLGIFMIAREKLGSISALILMVTFLIYPYIIGALIGGFYCVLFYPVLLIFAFYFFEKNNFRCFLLFFLLSFLVEESVILITPIFGIYAIIKRKRLKWIIIPILASFIWGIVSMYIITHFDAGKGPMSTWYFEGLCGKLGSSHIEVVRNISLHPGIAINNILQPDRIKYTVWLLQPLLFIPLLSVVGIFAIPQWFFCAVSTAPWLINPITHYNLGIASFLIIASVFSLKKISNWKLWRKLGVSNLNKISISITTCLLISTFLVYYRWWVPERHFSKHPKYEAIEGAIEHIPPEASVIMPTYMTPQLANRENFYHLHQAFPAEYVIFDKDIEYVLDKEGMEHLAKIILEKYDLIFQQQGIAVYKRQ